MREQRTAMETHISTIGWAVFWQAAIRWIALGGMLWLVLSFADGWIMAALAA